ncbi:MAG: hypothetical protein JRH20_22180 [Deltaproteobacteria bacterium]|nr:hypothetical protein [Deltaproteobacteria bacterium]
MSHPVQLRAVAGKKEALDSASNATPIAHANSAVPVLWLCTFEYGEVEVHKPKGANRTFFALVPAKKAAERAAAVRDAIEDHKTPIYLAAKTLARELDELGDDEMVSLYPDALFASMTRSGAMSYIKHLSQLCDLWQHFRGGLSWGDTRKKLGSISPEILTAVDHKDARLSRYYLVGSLADKKLGLDEYRVREGAGEDDVEPEALAVGEQGLLLGRFGGTWKLLSSGCEQDLLGVWAEGEQAFAVGRRGSVIQLKAGEAETMESSTEAALNAVWGLGSQSICAVGEAGTVIAFNGEKWQPWSVPTEAPLHAVWGTSIENLFIGGQESATYRFDGYSWNKMPLPTESMVRAFLGNEELVNVICGTSRGGLVSKLERGEWKSEKHPRLDWLEGGWFGWEDELSVTTGSGNVITRKEEGWQEEQLPLEQLIATFSSGEIPMVIGRQGEHALILARGDDGWEIEASVRGLQLFAIWVAGEPKPPRLSMTDDEKPPQPQSADS